jgi:hypothetical protein
LSLPGKVATHPFPVLRIADVRILSAPISFVGLAEFCCRFRISAQVTDFRSAGTLNGKFLTFQRFKRKSLEAPEDGRLLRLMGNSQGRDNVRKRARRRKKTERLALAKKTKKPAK